MEEAISAVGDGFTRLAAREVNLLPVMNLDLREIRGEVHVKGAHIGGAPSLAIKIVRYLVGEQMSNLPTGVED